MSKLKDAEEFLNRLRRIMLQNPNENFSPNFIYIQLMDYGIPSLYSNIPITPKIHFKNWIEDFITCKNTKVFHDPRWKYFCQFINCNPREFMKDMNFIKIYISLDKEHIYKGVKRIFGFLEKENIEHHSKVADEFRSDGIVIRLKANDIVSLKKLSNFIENDSYIQEGTLKTNPFTPTIGSMAVIKDNGDSYNEKLSITISKFLRETNLNKPIKIEEFIKYASKFFLEQGWDIWNETLLDAYNPKYGFKNFGDYNDLEQETPDAISMYEKAIIATYEKYGSYQALGAIRESIRGNYNLIPRYDKEGKTEIRGYLMDHLSGEKIKKYISDVENIRGIIDNNTIVSFFCKIMYKYKGQFFDNALKATVAKFRNDQESVKIRIRRYRDQGKPEEFTSYGLDPQRKFNYRQSVIDNVEPKEVMDVIKTILEIKEVEWRGLNDEEILEQYSNIILKELGLSTSRK